MRLPNDSDALPPTLAARLLSGAKASELSRLPARRVDGRSAVGLRLVPSDSRTTIARVDVWADEDSGLPVRVDVYAEGGASRPILTTQVVSLDTDRPAAALTSFETTRGMHFSRGAALDEAAGANAFAPFALPDEVADLPRRGRPEDQGAVGIYGRGPTALVAIPLRRSVAKGLYEQLSEQQQRGRVRAPGHPHRSGRCRSCSSSASTRRTAAHRDGHAGDPGERDAGPAPRDRQGGRPMIRTHAG